MQRATDRLGQKHYDLLVVGAGIQGAYIARLASAAGLSVALIERDDFGAATSHNSFKLIHAGFRYLQHADIRRIRQTIMSTRDWLQAAPEFIKPRAFLMPTYGHGVRGPEACYVAGKIYSMLTMDRNRGLPEESKLPAAKVIGSKAVKARLPGLPSKGLSGGVMWYDGQIQDADRLLLRTIQHAIEDGADAANYVEAKAFIREGGKILGVEAEDPISGRSLSIKADMTVLSCGPWTSSLLETLGLGMTKKLGGTLVKGINLVFEGRRLDFGLGVSSRSTSDALFGSAKRLHFLMPWHDCTVAGTTHEPYDGDPADFEISEEDVKAFVEDLNSGYPELDLKLEDVVYAYGGLTPGNDGADLANMRSRSSAIIDHEKTDSIRGLLSVVGVKYTTSVHLARSVVSHLHSRLGKGTVNGNGLNAGGTSRPLFVNGELDAYLRRLDAPEPDEWVTNAVENEMAVNLSDTLLRRGNLAERGKLSSASAQRAAKVMQRLHDWSDEETAAQLQALQQELAAHRARDIN